jgi:hypothetical protein
MTLNGDDMAQRPTADEYQQSLAKLRSTIAAAINDFESETGALVEEINLREIPVPGDENVPKEFRRGVEIRLRPRIMRVVES